MIKIEDFDRKYIRNYKQKVKRRAEEEPLTAGTSTYSWDEGGEMNMSFLRNHGMTKDDYLLDFGCGTLPLLDKFLRQGFHNYVGIDMCKESIDKGKGLISHDLNGVKFYVIDDFDFSMVKEKFNYVFAFSVMNHNPISHFSIFLKNIYEKTTHDVKMFFTIWKTEDESVMFSDGTSFYYGMKDMQNICRKLGYRFKYLNMKDYWKGMMGIKMGRFSMIKVEKSG